MIFKVDIVDYEFTVLFFKVALSFNLKEGNLCIYLNFLKFWSGFIKIEIFSIFHEVFFSNNGLDANFKSKTVYCIVYDPVVCVHIENV